MTGLPPTSRPSPGTTAASRSRRATSRPASRRGREAVADDPDVLAWLAALPRGQAAAEPRLRRCPLARRPRPRAVRGAAERAARRRRDDPRRRSCSRRTQTNEVGRLATLVPVFARLAEEAARPLALLEVGASAGLCLFPDRYAYAWPPLGSPGRSAATGARRPTAAGPLPVPGRPVPVAWRGGIDLDPVDVNDDAGGRLARDLHLARAGRAPRAAAGGRRRRPRATRRGSSRGDLFDLLPDQVAAAADATTRLATSRSAADGTAGAPACGFGGGISAPQFGQKRSPDGNALPQRWQKLATRSGACGAYHNYYRT